MADSRIMFCVVVLCTLGVCAGFQCPSSGKFVDPENCHNYYVCDSSLQAKQHSCLVMGHFDQSLQRCVMGPDCDGSAKTTAAPLPTQPATNFQCTTPGRFRDPIHCHLFYICDQNLRPSLRNCTELGYFDELSGFCVIGKCPDNPDNPVTNPPHGGFTCPSDGVFPDPKDCRGYYACKYGVAVHGICNGGGGHFDKEYLGCVPGRC